MNYTFTRQPVLKAKLKNTKKQIKLNWLILYYRSMNFSDFMQKYNGKGIDYDKSFGFACVDLFNQYLVDCFDIQNPIQMFPVVSAFQIWDRAENNKLFERIKNDPMAIPKPGDIMIWGKSARLFHGHVGVFISGDVMKFKSFDQNWPIGAL